MDETGNICDICGMKSSNCKGTFGAGGIIMRCEKCNSKSQKIPQESNCILAKVALQTLQR